MNESNLKKIVEGRLVSKASELNAGDVVEITRHPERGSALVTYTTELFNPFGGSVADALGLPVARFGEVVQGIVSVKMITPRVVNHFYKNSDRAPVAGDVYRLNQTAFLIVKDDEDVGEHTMNLAWALQTNAFSDNFADRYLLWDNVKREAVNA